MKYFKHAERMGNWNMHHATVSKMINLFAVMPANWSLTSQKKFVKINNAPIYIDPMLLFIVLLLLLEEVMTLFQSLAMN